MKRFMKTLIGKTVVFIACIISICILAGSVLGIAFMTQDGRFYRLQEPELVEQFIAEEYLRSYGFDTLMLNIYKTGGNGVERDYHYCIEDGNGEVVAESIFFNDKEDSFTIRYGIVKEEDGRITNVYYNEFGYGPKEITDLYSVKISLIKGSQLAMEVEWIAAILHVAYLLRYVIFLIALVALLATVLLFEALMYAAGRRSGTEDFVPGPFDKVPYDLILAFWVMVGAGACYVAYLAVDSELLVPAVIIVASVCLLGLCVALGLCMSAASRIKQHTFIKNTIIFRLLLLAKKLLGFIWKLLVKLVMAVWKIVGKFFGGIWRMITKTCSAVSSLFKSLPLIWKTAVAFGGISLAEFIVLCASNSRSTIAIFWLLEKVVLLPAILFLALTLRRLQKSGIALANGDLSYHTDTQGMIGDFKLHAEHLNSIADGMTKAVEERMKSERMKTELITNVSHDIKTPLTSIINYATLIGNEDTDNPKIHEYSEVLVRQSDKLKRLIEDLVEASKASTGNLEVILAPCDASVFISQAGGEYEEKLKKSELTLITKQTDKELRIMADGRRMWRIFDNLMNNICKYAQPGTRVYLSLEEQDGKAVFSFKNTSKDPLDMSEEELMERFTRGDSSRNTEGNGLGLSIAKSMAELQGGSLRLSVDGDLFKAVLTFPLVGC